jgi:hypothetical protein
MSANLSCSAYQESPFAFTTNSNRFNQQPAMFGQTLDPSGIWSQSEFQNQNFAGSAAQSQIIQSRAASVTQQYGQITPPNDDTSSEFTKDLTSQRILRENEQARTEKSERARNAAVQRHAKAKKERKDSQQSSSTQSDDDVDDKKEKYREKNRLAAAKCRAKKKDNIEGIEDKHRNLSALNAALKKQVQDLRGELTGLRTVALNHQGCNCRIARYNVNQAKKVAMGVDGVGSPTGYGTFGHDAACMDNAHGQRNGGRKSANDSSSSMGQMLSNGQLYAGQGNYAFASVTTSEEMNAIHGGHDEHDAQFANYMQSGYGGQGGFQ